MMKQGECMNVQIPKWISIVSGLISLLAFFVGASLYFLPSTFLKNVDVASSGVLFLIGMWASRQIAIAVVIGYSTIKQSASMLKISLGAYALMNVQDIGIGIAQRDIGLIMGATFFCALSIAMIVTLFLRDKGAK